MTQSESNADVMALSPVSSVDNVSIEPVVIYTRQSASQASVNSLHVRVSSLDTRVLVQVGSVSTQVSSVDANVTAVNVNVSSLHTRVASVDVRVSSISGGANFADIFTTAVSESYSSVGAEVTLGQYIYENMAFFRDFTIVGSTITSKKLNGSDTAMTHGINDATNPTGNNGRLT